MSSQTFQVIACARRVCEVLASFFCFRRCGGRLFPFIQETDHGRARQILVPARYGYRYDRHGCRVRYCIVPAHYEVIREPGRWEMRRRRVWVGR